MRRIFILVCLFIAGTASATEFSSYAAQMSELDMIRDAKDLTKAQQDQIISIYRRAKAEAASISADKAKVKGKLFKEMLAANQDAKAQKRLKDEWKMLNEREFT